MIFLNDEDIEVSAIVKTWLSNQEEELQSHLGGWVEDYFYKCLEWVQGHQVKIELAKNAKFRQKNRNLFALIN